MKFKIKFINPILYIHFFFYNLIEPASDWVNQIPYIQKFHVDLPGNFSAITFTPQMVNTQKLYLIWFAIRDFVHRKNLLKQIKKVTQFRNFILTHETNPQPPPTRIYGMMKNLWITYRPQEQLNSLRIPSWWAKRKASDLFWFFLKRKIQVFYQKL